MSDGDRALSGLSRRRTPVDGIPQRPWHEENTGVHTDTQVFHALKSLHGELQANKVDAAKAHGALSAKVATLAGEVSGIRTTVGDFDKKLDRVAESSAKAAGALEIIAPIVARSKSPSTDPHAAAKETLADHVLAAARADRSFSRKVWLKIITGAIAFATSGAFLHWWLAPHAQPQAVEIRSAP